jgi:hypothetical protein
MKNLALALAVLLASLGAQAQDMRPGIASIAIVTTEPDGRYGMDGEVLKPAKLQRMLELLDEQLAVGHLHLRKGQADITAERVGEIRRIADGIGARLMVERDGRMEPADVPAPPGT